MPFNVTTMASTIRGSEHRPPCVVEIMEEFVAENPDAFREGAGGAWVEKYQPCAECGEPATHLMANVAGAVAWEAAAHIPVCREHIRPYHILEVL